MRTPAKFSPRAELRRLVNSVWYSFPVQLLALQLRSNLFLLALWGILALFIGDRLAASFGVKYLFLEPEYNGHVGASSFFLLGTGLGGLVMTWNLTTYLLNARYFPFLATLQRPFGRYCINNAAIPLAFIGFYAWQLRSFLKSELAYGEGQLFLTLGYLLAGVAVVIASYIVYFRLTNKDIASFPNLKGLLRGRRIGVPLTPGHRGANLERIISGEGVWRVDIYLGVNLRPRRTRSIAHYRPAQLQRIFRQNHLNALGFQLLLLVTLVLVGQGIDYAWLRIPAGTSVFIIFSVVAAAGGAITYWFHAWRASIFLLLLLSINVLTSRNWFAFRNRAYGLSYSGELPTYNYDRLGELARPERVATDRDSMLRVLERWRARTGERRPRMVLLCVSGGGLKATYWTTHVLQQAQLATDGSLTRHTSLISGASGGMIGAAYFRELNLLSQNDPRVTATDPTYLEASGKDLLNSVGFAIVTKDLFFSAGTFEHEGEHFQLDRAYAFERQLNENLDHALGKPLGAYEAPERAAEIPMVLLTPSVVNDARRLIISPLGVSHLMLPPIGVDRPETFEVDAIDFGAFFRDANPERLSFTTALRMNATYPYVLPNVYLPSNPPVEVMDAGFRDNFGVLQASRFIQVYRDWILDNTSGVALVQISTLDKFEAATEAGPQGWISSLFNPLGVAGQLMSLQDFQADESIGLLSELLGPEYFDFVRFSYRPAADREAASMTFHLTEGEKADIRASIAQPENRAAMGQLSALLGYRADQLGLLQPSRIE